MDRRTTLTRLTVERLDERIVPSQGHADVPAEPHGLALGLAKHDLDEPPRGATGHLKDLEEDALDLVSTAVKHADHSVTTLTVDKPVEREPKPDDLSGR